ncbi:MAG: peptide deformylase [Oligoflexia bacterium]|nr:peptide deformylase [Oligoflexia bacterium]
MDTLFQAALGGYLLKTGDPMAILDIIIAPHPTLSRRCRLVRPDELGQDLAAQLSNMAETMYAAPGVGLAAPQVGDLRCIVVADPGAGEEDEGLTLYQMVNPKIVEASHEMTETEEQCLSVPDITVKVTRHLTVVVAWIDALGQPQRELFEDWSSIVIQHELDHLIGKTLYDRASRLKRSRYLKARKKAPRPLPM